MILEPEEVTKDKFVEILRNAAFDIVVRESEIYVKDISFPLWLVIDTEKQFIKIYTYLKFKETTTLNLLNNFSSDCNSTYELIQFSNTNYKDERNYFYGFYYIYYNFGVIPQQIIYTIRKFASIFIAAVREKDLDGIYFN